SLLARQGLSGVNPQKEDVFLQIRPAGSTDILCARMPADKFMKMHRSFKFWDRKHHVASAKGIDDLTVKVRRNGTVRFRTTSRRGEMVAPQGGPLQITVAFHDATGTEATNRCSTQTKSFRTGRRGALRTP